ncbi:FIG001571: Hypothetical protein [Pseudoalteromonas luteoviolacea B = ATCC 29581]|nr:FIG001571: Hypothetical protein [Pseudoalteromonas luteoviolacea B = ATCC 29581]
MMWVDLDDTTSLQEAFSATRFGALRFNELDYLKSFNGGLKQRALLAAKECGGKVEAIRKVYSLCQVRCFGFYFSPVNFYFFEANDGNMLFMLAEVSNTPWNETHYYLVPMQQENVNFEKTFHVSPFMDLAMNYHWKVKVSSSKLFINIENKRESNTVFNATLALQKEPLTAQSCRKVLKTFPVMTWTIVKGIYWHALRLFIKRVPFISHPGPSHGKSNNTH